jgi:hypothetical protein
MSKLKSLIGLLVFSGFLGMTLAQTSPQPAPAKPDRQTAQQRDRLRTADGTCTQPGAQAGTGQKLRKGNRSGMNAGQQPGTGPGQGARRRGGRS